MKPTRLLTFLLLLFLLTGCLPQVKLTAELETENGRAAYHCWSNYKYLDSRGVLQLEAKAGQTLHLDFKSVVKQGSLEVKVLSPRQKTLWSARVTQSGLESADIPLPADGLYAIRIWAKKTSGSYDIRYHLKED